MSVGSDESVIDVDELLRPHQAQKEIDFMRVQSLYDIAKSVDTNPAVLTEFNIRLREIHTCRDSFQKAVTEINRLRLQYKPNYKANYQELRSFDQLYFYILSVAENHCSERKNINNLKCESDRDSRPAKPKLPKLNLFHFDSKLENWQTFYDTFYSLIHTHKDISNIEKYYYLLSSVSGPAQTLVKSIPITADNYHFVWSLLVKKFENKRVLATNYLDKMFNFKPLQTESAVGLNTFLQTFQECVKALNVLNLTDLSGFLLFYISQRNLDTVTRREFEQSVEQDEIPTYTQLIEFVEKHLRVLEMSESKTQIHGTTVQKLSNTSSTSRVTSKVGTYNVNKLSQSQKPCLSVVSVDKPRESYQKQIKSNGCLFCNKQHSIYKCYGYAELTPAQRLTKVKELRLCENCLRDNHTLQNCPSKIRCTLCKQMHHHTLHLDSSDSRQETSNQEVRTSSSASSDQVVALTCTSRSTVVLGTAVVHVADDFGQYHSMRAVIDSGAMSSYMTSACAKRLGLPRRKCTFEPVGLGGVPVQNFGVITICIKPLNSPGPMLKTETVIVPQITGNLPTTTLSNKVINEFRNLELADPGYCTSAPVDLLLASDLFPYIYDGQKIMPREPGLPVAMHSIFGYVITGQTVLGDNPNDKTTSCNLLATTNNIENIMTSFWEIENIERDVPGNPDDDYVEQLFSKDHGRDSTGRYVVKYPLKTECELGESRAQAERRLINLDSKLNRLPNLKKEYQAFMSDYESMGHMTCLGELGTVRSKYLIPHFCVLRPSSSSTKLRVVFDASCATTNGNSLNSVVHAGPKLQADINEVLINFRLHEICFSCDIRMMFRMIGLDKSQRMFQHILWRFSQDQPIKVYELNTVTYGVASSPYLAIRVLHQLADDEGGRYPLGAHVLKRGGYVDDILWSIPTREEAFQLQEELIALLKAGGFELRKWYSNCPQLLQRVPDDHRETHLEFQNDKDLSIKVLGLQWIPAEDAFSFTITPPSDKVTKRTVLSQIGRQYDPLGFVAPCVFLAKCIMQKLWLQELDWDESLPPALESEWLQYVSELPLLSSFRHARQVTVSQHSYYQILGFSDASILGYAAAVYLRSYNQVGMVKISLVIAKSRVAPTRTRSIPRLELQGALLLAQLVDYTRSILTQRIPVHEIYLFTDSTIVLAWLNTPGYKLQTYVATRVAKILDITPVEVWYHVEGACDPADVCSRGALPSLLLSMPEWLSGPRWAYAAQSEWPVKAIDQFKSNDVPELKNVTLFQSSSQHTSDAPDSNIIFNLTEKYSSFAKLQRVIARCFQFSQNCRTKSKIKRITGSPCLIHLSKSLDAIIKCVQNHHFSSDIAALQKGNYCSQSLRKLNPFIDPLGFLRVGGRLSQSTLPYQKKHPLVLPKTGNFTKILINYFHIMYLHVGPRTLQSLLNQKYWIISARSIIRSVVSKCIPCFRVKPTIIQPIMGTLPRFRSEDIHAFHTVGVDIGGPFYTKESTRRNAKIFKSYLCVFVCFSTRAVHLEVLTSLSAECFLAVFDRFTARRGLCHTIVSDNGTNFVAAGKHLAEVAQFFKQSSDQILNELATRGIQWRYQPPTGSHFGGMYERVILSAKRHLKRVTGEKALTFEELGTLFARVEAVLNSRPLCSLSTDPSEFEALTPGHFLVGRELLAVPEYELSDESVHRLTRWQLVQQASQRFWKLWRKEYLHTLQQRQKWLNNSRNIQVGELVLIHSDAPPLQWHLGRVTALKPGPDGVVRVVRVRTATTEITRPVVKISPLPIEPDVNSP